MIGRLNKVRENNETYDNLRFLSRQHINNINLQFKQLKQRLQVFQK